MIQTACSDLGAGMEANMFDLVSTGFEPPVVGMVSILACGGR